MRAIVTLVTLASIELTGARIVPAAELVRVATTAHAVYYAARPQDVDVRRSEAFLERLDRLFGAAPVGWRLSYYRHLWPEDVQAGSGLAFPVSGVTDMRTGRIDSVRPYHPHELVHAATGRIGRPPLFFAEGLAVALTGEGRWHGRETDSIASAFLERGGDMMRVLQEFALEDPERDYALAGSFVAFLLDRFGVDAMMVFLRASDQQAFCCERALRSAFGDGFTGLVEEWRRSLNAGAPARRAWYDSATWPQSLRRSAAAKASAAVEPTGPGLAAHAPSLPTGLAAEAQARPRAGDR